MEINYDLIIKYLTKNVKVNKEKPTEKNDFKYFNNILKDKCYLKVDYDNSLLSSIIFWYSVKSP